ncbi:AGAP008057-PA, partial [Anopheles gambiae str. PEST]
GVRIRARRSRSNPVSRSLTKRSKRTISPPYRRVCDRVSRSRDDRLAGFVLTWARSVGVGVCYPVPSDSAKVSSVLVVFAGCVRVVLSVRWDTTVVPFLRFLRSLVR